MSLDVLIIGAGMSGLAAGIRAAYYNKKVCILEKHSKIGGLNSFYTKNGYKFDVGLHALTNYVPKSTKNTPFPKLLRQLRLKYEDFSLSEQIISSIKFPRKTLYFTNEREFLFDSINDNFPAQKDNFQRLLRYISEFDELDLHSSFMSARTIVASFISDPLLVDMLFCPLMFYGCSGEHDMDFSQFAVMFKSIFCEGFARPAGGVRPLLSLLLKKYVRLGGTLHTRSAVKKILVNNDAVRSVLLENGEEIRAKRILSSIGYFETGALCSPQKKSFAPHEDRVGKLSFVELIVLLNRSMNEQGFTQSICFFSQNNRFHYKRPDDFVDTSSGVICCPNNFNYKSPLKDNILRVTCLANFSLWNNLREEDYQRQKERAREMILRKVITLIPDFRDSIVFSDIFTPRTVYNFTGHINGAVYGTPYKKRDGLTPFRNLYICGTDQGFLGIIGALLSGISMANLYLLK
ncbi:MAG: phytoene desaturase family protein [bacterium]